MGLNYGFDIICHRDELWNFIDSVVDLDNSTRNYSTTLIWGEQKKVVPLWRPDNKGSLKLDDPENDSGFCLSLPFIMDEDIRNYLQENQEDFLKQNTDKETFNHPLDDEGRVYIGCIYFYIVTDLEAVGRTGYDSDLVWFEFEAATTRMSYLFQKSQSIQRVFIELAKQHNAICCLFASGGTGAARVLWLDGKEYNIELPDDWLPLNEVRKYAK